MMKKKILALSMVACLAATALVGGTLAYFTDATETKVNEFTVGNVDIDLTEPNWKGDATLMPGKSYEKDPTITVAQNSQDCYAFLKLDMNKYVSLVNLMGVDAYKNNIGGLQGEYPGFTKFVVDLVADDDLRMAVVDRWFTGINHKDWKVMNVDEIQALVASVANKQNPDALTVIFGYIGSEDDILTAGESVTFMTEFGMPSTVTSSMFDGEDAYKIEGVSKSNFNTDASTFKMKFTAYAIQATEIANIDAAYTALFN